MPENTETTTALETVTATATEPAPVETLEDLVITDLRGMFAPEEPHHNVILDVIRNHADPEPGPFRDALGEAFEWRHEIAKAGVNIASPEPGEQQKMCSDYKEALYRAHAAVKLAAQ